LEFVRRAILTDQKSVAEFQTPIMGEPRWFRIAIQPIHGVNEQVTHALINATDINDLKTAQQKLMELNQTLEERIKQRSAEVQDLYDNAPAGYHSLDKDGLFVMINQTELNWLGYTREEILGVKNFRDLQSTESQQIFDESFQILMEQGWIKDIEFEVLRKDGSRMPVLLSKYSKEIISGGTLLA
jgi:PAS domain S-box-containing protein